LDRSILLSLGVEIPCKHVNVLVGPTMKIPPARQKCLCEDRRKAYPYCEGAFSLFLPRAELLRGTI